MFFLSFQGFGRDKDLVLGGGFPCHFPQKKKKNKERKDKEGVFAFSGRFSGQFWVCFGLKFRDGFGLFQLEGSFGLFRVGFGLLRGAKQFVGTRLHRNPTDFRIVPGRFQIVRVASGQFRGSSGALSEHFRGSFGQFGPDGDNLRCKLKIDTNQHISSKSAHQTSK